MRAKSIELSRLTEKASPGLSRIHCRLATMIPKRNRDASFLNPL